MAESRHGSEQVATVAAGKDSDIAALQLQVTDLTRLLES
eukprot:SAG25_NODE_10323_length_338_cov_0.694561_2_plen_38_part_01